MTTGEFNEDDLDKVCNQTYLINDIVNTYKKLIVVIVELYLL